MTLLTRLGILEVAFSAVILPVLLFEPAQRLFPRLLKDHKQLLQVHLDYFFMGILRFDGIRLGYDGSEGGDVMVF
ncbi:hypothetical protein CEE37_12650 [candidate division LCP-89 bacterium B3_LCP]|uniref:Uncharacterized protein n=1 Tax=candidate division LCP-89 bacterium B3_LCP TaxID=2012998 RepID=A0A532UTU2_UNCL8|nr:MAG: hypothetical protein CEE37_12650 [candidate division LCP-89 bacterium B3_LCP]